MRKKLTAAAYLLALVLLLIVWYAASAFSKLPFIPSPVTVIQNTLSIFLPEIVINAGWSLWRIFAGISLSILLGVPLGLCMGYYSFWDKLLSPLMYLLYPIPKIALLPLVMLFLGLGEASKVAMLVMIVIFQVLVASRDSAKAIPPETYDSLHSLGATDWDIFRKAVFPASMPGILTSLRVSLGTALSVLFFTETFGTEHGMGYFIMDSWMRVDYVDMFSGILVLSIIGVLLFLCVDVLERTLCMWNRK